MQMDPEAYPNTTKNFGPKDVYRFLYIDEGSAQIFLDEKLDINLITSDE